jgi:three-Cys-motif partner protein
MAGRGFGGDWTEDKLRCLAKYLTAYRTIFTGNEKARHLKTWYVDAFAGTGSRSLPGSVAEPDLFEDVYDDEVATGYRDGSAKKALGLRAPFDYYLFVDKSKSHVNALKTTVGKDYPGLLLRCDFRVGDANEVLRTWCGERNWKNERAVVFLDPYGMQVEWNTVEMLGASKAVDLWYLFPLGVGVVRLLSHDGNINEAWKKRLDLLFGTSDWQSRFYERRTTPDLFGALETVERDAPVEKIQAFIHQRLSMCFVGEAKGKVLRNSKANPLYVLCFAAANKRGAPTALRIAQDILDD